MKSITKIIGIGIIALIAMTCIGAVSAEPVERTVLGNAWNYDVVGDDFDYFIYDGTSDTASSDVWLRESIGGSETHYDPSPDHDDDRSDSVSKNVPGKNPNVGKHIAGVFTPEHPEPMLPLMHSPDFTTSAPEGTATPDRDGSINEVIGDWDCGDHDSASETHDDPSADHADDHSDSESKNINTGLNRDRF